MTEQQAIMILECMATDMVGAMADLRETNPMLDVLQQRVDAINVVEEALGYYRGKKLHRKVRAVRLEK